MLPCYQCAYKDDIPGDAHIRCRFAWSTEKRPEGHPHGIKHGWFIFPLNYDPTWGPDTCVAQAKTRDPEKVDKGNPLSDLLSILGRRWT